MKINSGMKVIYGNEDVSSAFAQKPVEHCGKVYWPSFVVARANAAKEGECRVLRWVKGPNRYATLYC